MSAVKLVVEAMVICVLCRGKEEKKMMVFLRRSFFETLWRRGNQMEAGIFSEAVEGVLSSSRHARRKHQDNSGRKRLQMDWFCWINWDQAIGVKLQPHLPATDNVF